LRTTQHILFISSWYPSRKAISAGIFIQRYAQAVHLFHKVSVLHVCSAEEKMKNNYFVESRETDGLKEHIVYYSDANYGLAFISKFVKFFRYLKAHRKGLSIIFRESPPDIVHLQVIFRAAVFLLFNRSLRKIPLFITEHWSGYYAKDGNYKGYFMKKVTETIINRSIGITLVSSQLQQAMLKHGLSGNYTVIPNVVDTALFTPGNKSPIENKSIQLLHISTLNDKEKNISGILRVFHKLCQSNRDIQLIFLGEGAERPVFEDWCKEKKILNTQVVFKGFVPATEVVRYLQETDLLLSFSHYDTFGCTLAEAMSCGVPVIASSTTGISSHIDKSRGYVVKEGDEEALFTTLQCAMRECKDFDRQKIREYALRTFSYEKVGKQFSDLYLSKF
jgi:L-malate glycosyltransferase